MGARRRKNQQVPLVEWIAGAVGLAIVVATIVFIGYEGYRGDGDSPDLRVEVADSAPGNAGHLVRVIVRNAGRRAAASVIVEGTARDLRSEVHLDYVAGLSEQTATLVFAETPDAAALSVRIVGFTTP